MVSSWLKMKRVFSKKTKEREKNSAWRQYSAVHFLFGRQQAHVGESKLYFNISVLSSKLSLTLAVEFQFLLPFAQRSSKSTHCHYLISYPLHWPSPLPPLFTFPVSLSPFTLKILYSIWPLVKNALIIQPIQFLLQTNLSISNPHERLS